MTAPYAERVHVWCLTDTVWLPGDGPRRIQLRRVKGWRKPEGSIVVSRPSKWGNPFVYRTSKALARVPALDGGPWEYEGRISAAGMQHDYFHPGGLVTRHTVRYLTLPEIVEVYRKEWADHGRIRTHRGPTVADLDQLRGHDLCCWCPLDQPCHGDVLLELANL